MASQAPAVEIKGREGGGVITISIIGVGEFYLQKTHAKVGAIQATVELEISINITNGNHFAATTNITRFNLTEVGANLGITQDALDSVASVARDMAAKKGTDNVLWVMKEYALHQANKFFEENKPLELSKEIEGVPKDLPPIQLAKTEVRLLDGAVWVGTDFSVPSKGLSGLGLNDTGECRGV